MTTAARWTVRILLALSVLLLGYGAISQLKDGLALDRAVPVPSYMIAGKPMQRLAYLRAATALKNANPADGTARIARVEAAINSGASGISQINDLETALKSNPSSARGWLLLARVWMSTDRAKAAAALSQALVLAPSDYWVAEGRADCAANLWADLDADTRSRAIDQVRLLWDEPLLRPQLWHLLHSPQGAALVTRAFAGQRNELIALNRWLSAERRRYRPVR